MKKLVYLPAKSRVAKDYGWLQSFQSFDLGAAPDPLRTDVGPLIVLNEDIVAPGRGFREHRHDNMEIISIPLYGTITHRDSAGHESRIAAGDVQVMSAGTGIAHSEFNKEPVSATFLQIWILPERRNVQPGHQQLTINKRSGAWTLFAGPKPDNGVAVINQSAWLSMGYFDKIGNYAFHTKKEGNAVYLFVIDGVLDIDGAILRPRDAMVITGADELMFYMQQPSQVLAIEVTV